MHNTGGCVNQLKSIYFLQVTLQSKYGFQEELLVKSNQTL